MTPQSEAGRGLPQPPRPRASPESSDPGGTCETRPLSGPRGPGALSLPPPTARPNLRTAPPPPPRAPGTSGARTSSREDQAARAEGARARPRGHTPARRRGVVTSVCARPPAPARFPEIRPSASMRRRRFGSEASGTAGVRKGAQTFGPHRPGPALTACKRVVFSPG